MSTALLLILLSACGDKDTTTPGPSVDETSDSDDTDGQGDPSGPGSDGDDTGEPGGGDTDEPGGDDTGEPGGPTDADGDGYDETEDCDDDNAAVSPGAVEIAYNGLDDDCDPLTPDDDLDGDGYATSGPNADCDDADPAVHPDAVDAPYDGIDSDCSGGSDYDADGDGYDSEEYADPGAPADCDDTDAATFPEAPEVWGDGVDQDCDGLIDAAGAECSAAFTLTLPDDSTAELDGCLSWSMTAGFEYDPDDPPELRDLQLELNGTTEAGFECQVLITQEEICGAGFYDQYGEYGQTVFITTDCSGVADAYEDTYTASAGWLRLDTVDAGSDPGSFVGVPLLTTVSGALSVSDSGLTLEGAFEVALEQLAGDSEEVEDCAIRSPDNDGDGYDWTLQGGTDCDDDDADAWQGAAALEDASACMRDADDDGWGDIDPPMDGEAGTDCDDDDDAVWLGAAENEDASACMRDADGDGWGDDDVSDPVEVGTDCIDTDPVSYPGALEVLDDGVDNNCNGVSVDVAYTPNLPAIEASSGVVDLGLSVSIGGDVNGDGYDDVLVGAPGSYNATGSAVGVAYLVLGPMAGDIMTDDAEATLLGESTGDLAGAGVSIIGDVNGDGYDDILVGSPDHNPGGGGDGQAYLVLGPVSGELSLADADAQLKSDGDGAAAGAVLGAAGDLTDDSSLDVVVCDYHYSGGGMCAVVSGAVSGDVSLADADARVFGEDTYDLLGSAVSGGGDANGDGDADLLIGASGAGSSSAGEVYLFYGPLTGDLDIADADRTLVGEDYGDDAGAAVSWAGDVDGDGDDDLLVGAESYDSKGIAYLVLSPPSRSSLADAEARLYTEESNAKAGFAVAGGDLDGDGRGDIVISAPGADNISTDRGYTFAYLDMPSGDVVLEDTNDFYLYGTSNSRSGFALSAGGDIDGDGLDDLLVGSDGDGAWLFSYSDL